MPTYDDLQSKKSDLIRKALDGSCFAAGQNATPIERLTGPTGELLALPTGTGVNAWGDVGYLTSDGMQQSRESSQSEVTSFGRQTPTRTDITADVTTVTISAQETNLRTIGMATGFDMATVRPLQGGEVVLRKPARPSPRIYRILNLAVDLNDAGEIYIARFYPRAKVTSFGEQPFGGGDDPILWPVTLTAEMDDDLGFSEAWHFGGPGWRAILDDMGFPAEETGA